MTALETINSQYEQLKMDMGLEMYRQTAGLAYDADKLEEKRNEMTALCEGFLQNFTDPRLMRLGALGSVSYAARLPFRLKLVDERIRLITTRKFQYNHQPVTWASWRQFNAQTTDHAIRKQVFDTFIQKAPQLIPLVKDGFQVVQDVYTRFDSSPLAVYLDLEGLDYSTLTRLIQNLGDGARTAFNRAVDHYADQIKHAPYEYYDDFYYFRGHIFQPLDSHLRQIPMLKAVKRVLKGLGFPVHEIHVDAEDRPKKSPSAFCFAIQVPSDVRVVYKPVSPGTDLGSMFHEFGHGIHGISGQPADPSWKRYVVPRSVAETFSFLIESLISNPLFLDEQLHLPAQVIQELVDRRRFMNLFFTVFYSANALMKLAFWKRPLTCEQASDYWQRLTKRFMIEVPGNYWLLHHIMSNYTIYAPSYLLAAVRVQSLLKHLVKTYGDCWWRIPAAGIEIQELAAMRGEFPLDRFPLDPTIYLDRIQKLSIL